MTSVSYRLLIAWIVCLVVGTLAPFNFGGQVDGRIHAVAFFQFSAFERDPLHFLFNLALFLPVGVFWHHGSRQRSLRDALVTVGVGAAVFSGTIECLQAWLPTRNSSLFDLIANVSGALVGVAADRRWGQAVQGAIDRLQAHTSPRVLAIAVGVVLLAALVTSGLLATGQGISIVNELAGSR